MKSSQNFQIPAVAISAAARAINLSQNPSGHGWREYRKQWDADAAAALAAAVPHVITAFENITHGTIVRTLKKHRLLAHGFCSCSQWRSEAASREKIRAEHEGHLADVLIAGGAV